MTEYLREGPKVLFGALMTGFAWAAVEHYLPPKTSLWVSLLVVGSLVIVSAICGLLVLQGVIIPRRFANLVYLFDDECNVAVLDQVFYGRVQPPGKRLGYHEQPHVAVSKVLKDQLGLDDRGIERIPDAWAEWRHGKVTLVPPPIQVQIEKRKHRFHVREHYDFVYLCTIRGVKPTLKKSSYSPRWSSLDELKEERAKNAETGPYEDVVPTVERLKKLLERLRSQSQSASRDRDVSEFPAVDLARLV